MAKLTFVLVLVALFALTAAKPQVNVVDGAPPGGVQVVDGEHQLQVVDGEHQLHIVDGQDQLHIVDNSPVPERRGGSKD